MQHVVQTADVCPPVLPAALPVVADRRAPLISSSNYMYRRYINGQRFTAEHLMNHTTLRVAKLSESQIEHVLSQKFHSSSSSRSVEGM